MNRYQKQGLAYYKAVSRMLKIVRRKRKVSLRQLTQLTGVRHSTIHRLEQGKQIAAGEFCTLAEWANIFHQDRIK